MFTRGGLAIADVGWSGGPDASPFGTGYRLDRIATADGSLCLTDAAMELQVRPKDLIGYLTANH